MHASVGHNFEFENDSKPSLKEANAMVEPDVRARLWVAVSWLVFALAVWFTSPNANLAVASERPIELRLSSQSGSFAASPKLAGRVKPAFEANVGQLDPRVRFLARGYGSQLFLTSNEAIFHFGSDRRAALRMRLRNASSHPRIEGLEAAPGYSNYFGGKDRKNWIVNVPHYTKVRYQEIYPRIDLVYHATQHQFEYDFILHPGSKPETVTLDFLGAKALAVNVAGDLVLQTEVGEVRHKKPFAYQVREGKQNPVQAEYVLAGPQSAGFKLGSYDPRLPLVIDPVLTYSTFQGGSGSDQAYSVTVDSAGNTYLTGTAESIDLPTQTPYQPYPNDGKKNAFVMKLNSEGTSLLYATYLGGNADDEGLAIAVDSTGAAYVAGYTDSTDFPTANPFLASSNGDRDGFVTKLNASGNALIYSTYLGGSGSDLAFAIAADAEGSFYVAGSTTSTSLSTANPYQANLGGMRDAFVTKFSATGSTLLYSTYLGGDADDVAYAIAVDAAGSAYLTGITQSDNFPTASALQNSYEGSTDVFVTKLTPAGSGLVYSTYLGGGFFEDSYSIAVDASGSAYVAGSTESANFPTTSPYQDLKRAGADVFITKLSSSGRARVYSTFLGGDGEDRANAIAVDSLGNATVTGYTLSSDFPTSDALQPAYGGGQDAFVTKFNANGLSLLYSTYLGGIDKDTGNGVALDSAGDAHVAGTTLSSNFPVTTASPTYRGAGDAFVLKDYGKQRRGLVCSNHHLVCRNQQFVLHLRTHLDKPRHEDRNR